MPTTIIQVYNSSLGRYETRARVVLEWTGLTSLGQSNSVYTNEDGQAVIDHSSTGSAIVYVNGKQQPNRVQTPGHHTVTI